MSSSRSIASNFLGIFVLFHRPQDRCVVQAEDVCYLFSNHCHIQLRIQNFPEGGAPTPKMGVLTIILQIFWQKLHENERIWTGGVSLATPLDPPMT